MEFKASLVCSDSLMIPVDIETEWNLKIFRSHESLICNLVDIETEWNLKVVAGSYVTPLEAVDIETEWNLK